MKTGKAFRRWIVYKFALLGIFLAGSLDIATGRRIGTLLSRFIFYILPREREKAINGLRIAFPEKTDRERQAIALKSFQNFGKSFFECIYFSKRPGLLMDEFIAVEGMEHFDNALSRGKGVLAVTGHIGNWELLGMYMAQKGYQTTVIAREVNNEGINNFMVEFHRQNGILTILRNNDWGTVKRILNVLHNNHLLGVLIDQDARVPAVFVDFFGKPARTPSGPVAMALTTGAAIISAFIIREADDRHRIIVKPVPVKKVGNRKENILYHTWVLTKIMEDVIRQHPDQWVWMHRRWRRQPKEGERSYPSGFQTSVSPANFADLRR